VLLNQHQTNPSRHRQSGLTIIQLVVSLGLLGILAYFTSQTFQQFRQGQQLLESKRDAGEELNTIEQRVTKYFRTRLRNHPTIQGFQVTGCVTPTSTAPCNLDVYRRKNAGTATETLEVYRFNTTCRSLTTPETKILTNTGVTAAAVTDSMKDLCGQNFKCPSSQVPMLTIKHCTGAVPNPAGAGCDLDQLPSKVKSERTLAGGICVRNPGTPNPDVIVVEAAFAHVATSGLGLVRKEFVLATIEDMSNVEWLP